jgi:uncharacterized protein DUF3761/SH3 domain-containing protein
MPKLASALLAACLSASALAAQAQLANTTAYTTAAVTVRVRPDARAKSVARLAAESPVQVSACVNGWCQIAVNGIAGYLPRLSLSQEPNGSFTQGAGYTNSKGQKVQSPTRTADNQPPVGATAQCRDGTFSFSQSRRGTCSHHGGVATWLN